MLAEEGIMEIRIFPTGLGYLGDCQLWCGGKVCRASRTGPAAQARYLFRWPIARRLPEIQYPYLKDSGYSLSTYRTVAKALGWR